MTTTYKGKSSRTCPQTIRIRNHTAGTWTTLDVRSVGTSEVQVADLVPPGTLAEYVSGPSGNGEVWVQVLCRRRSSAQSFVASGELLQIAHG